MKDSIMTLSDIEEKDVINVVTGERIGFVSSLRIDTNSGQIIAITVQPSMRFVSFFSKDESAVVVPWNQILKIGEDVIIVNVAQRLNEYKAVIFTRYIVKKFSIQYEIWYNL